MRGQFRFWPGQKKELLVPNNILDQGESDFLEMIARGNNLIVAEGGNFYMGLCGATMEDNFTLATIVGEPSVTNNYARKPISRDDVGWPTLDLVGGVRRIASLVVNFEAIGGNFSTSIQRAFLCNVVSGTAGRLFSMSGALPSSLLITPGAPVPVTYEMFLR